MTNADAAKMKERAQKRLTKQQRHHKKTLLRRRKQAAIFYDPSSMQQYTEQREQNSTYRSFTMEDDHDVTDSENDEKADEI